jgi:hypothetical protein
MSAMLMGSGLGLRKCSKPHALGVGGSVERYREVRGVRGIAGWVWAMEEKKEIHATERHTRTGTMAISCIMYFVGG